MESQDLDEVLELMVSSLCPPYPNSINLFAQYRIEIADEYWIDRIY